VESAVVKSNRPVGIAVMALLFKYRVKSAVVKLNRPGGIAVRSGL